MIIEIEVNSKKLAEKILENQGYSKYDIEEILGNRECTLQEFIVLLETPNFNIKNYLTSKGIILKAEKDVITLSVSNYIAIDKKIKELEVQREKMKPDIIKFMKDHKLKTLSKLTLIETIKQKLDANKIYKFLGFKKFMLIAKVTMKDAEQYLNKIDIGKCASDEIGLPEYSLRVNHGAID